MKKINFTLIVVSLIFILSTCFFNGNTSVSVSPVIKAIGLPSDITSVELTVSGPGMNTIGVVYDGLPSSIDLTVPSGSDRTFELVVYVDDPVSAATSFKGTATIDLSQGNSEVVLGMIVNSTKLLIPNPLGNRTDPDPESAPIRRLLQFDNVNGLNGTALTELQFATITGIPAWETNFYPYAVDFDRYGRIYFANFSSGVGYRKVIRIDNITGINAYLLFVDQTTSITALTIDRQSDIVYYSTSSSLFKSDLNGFGENPLTINSAPLPADQILTIRGMAITDDGIMYITGTNASTNPTVFRYDPTLQTVMATYTMPDAVFSNPWDVLIKDDFIYVTNPDGADGRKIIQLDLDLAYINGYGIFKDTVWLTPDTAPDHFYMPRQFIATLNKKITIIDDCSGEELDKLISIDDINGTNWTTNPSTGDGQNLFMFYAVC